MKNLTVPQIDGENLEIGLIEGQALYVIGANGSGKSSLLGFWRSSHRENARLIAGNREIILDNSAVSISPAQTRQFDGFRSQHESLSGAGFRATRGYSNNEHRLKALLAQIVDKVNYQSRLVSDLYRQGKKEEAEELNQETLLDKLNSALAAGNLPIEITIDDRSTYMVKKSQKYSYEMKELSDGERAALFLGMEVLLAGEGDIILIDEPERHLHRSISEPFFRKLRELRTDLYYVIATHDLALPRADKEAAVLTLFAYEPRKWRAHYESKVDKFDPEIVEAILGAREKVLFVEGDQASLDHALYTALFPEHTVIPSGNCRDVINHVETIANTTELNHMEAIGIVDGDNKTGEDKDNIIRLPYYSVEALWYHPKIIEMVAKHMQKNCKDAIDAALNALLKKPDLKHLEEDLAYKRLLEEYEQKRPRMDDFPNCPPIELTSGETLLAKATEDIQAAIKSGDWLSVLKSVNLKETGVINTIVKQLDLSTPKAYQRIARDQIVKSKIELKDLT